MRNELLIIGVVAFATLSNSLVFADNTQVYIMNGTAKECAPKTSCFFPYQVSINAGDTVTWINQDNKTHTATTGSSNYGPVGYFDSGIIEPGKSFTQFFGTIGKYQYIDKTNPSMTGMVVVTSGKLSHAELSWVNGTLKIFDQLGNETKTPFIGQSITITKDITNSGNTDANSIFFRLKIMNSTNFLLYDKFTKVDVGAKKTVPVSFNWLAEKSGTYYLLFDANPSNLIGDTNENNDISFDNLIIVNRNNSTHNISDNASNGNIYNVVNSTANENTITAVPEFGSLAVVILAAAITSIVGLSTKIKLARH